MFILFFFNPRTHIRYGLVAWINICIRGPSKDWRNPDEDWGYWYYLDWTITVGGSSHLKRRVELTLQVVIRCVYGHPESSFESVNRGNLPRFPSVVPPSFSFLVNEGQGQSQRVGIGKWGRFRQLRSHVKRVGDACGRKVSSLRQETLGLFGLEEGNKGSDFTTDERRQ